MATCKDCDATVVWLRKPDGSWAPPVEPTLDLANGDYVMASAEGTIQPIPQVYKRHHCLTPEERDARRKEREEERERLIAEDRARRAEAQRIEEERLAALRAQEEEEAERERETREALKKARDHDRALRCFKPARLLVVACRDCGAEEGEPCLSASSWSYYNVTPHNSRFEDGPPAKPRRQAERWGDDYDGPWPPLESDPGRYHMRNWLAENFTIFDSDEYRDRDWMTPIETARLSRWLAGNAHIFQEEVTDARSYNPADVL